MMFEQKRQQYSFNMNSGGGGGGSRFDPKGSVVLHSRY